MLNQRQVKILLILHRAQGYITLGKIAAQINFSLKTVRNDIASIKKYLAEIRLGRIVSKAHHGICLEISENEWEKLSGLLNSKNSMENCNAEVSYKIIYMLLKKQNISISTIERSLYLSRSSIEKTLVRVNSWFEKNHITFIREKGLRISCEEINWRLAMWDLYTVYEKDRDTEQNKQPNGYSPFAYRIIEDFLSGFNTADIVKTVDDLEKEHGLQLTYETYIRMIFLVSLCVIRCQNHMASDIPISPDAKDKMDSEFNLSFTTELSASLEKIYHIELAEPELQFLKFVVETSEIQTFENEKAKQLFQCAHPKLCHFTVKFISLMSEILNVNLKTDPILAETLFLYLRSMIARLKYHTRFENPLLSQIKQKYPDLLTVAWASEALFEKDLGLDVNEDEIGFLAIYLGGAIERYHYGLTACIICNYGIGVSQIIKEKIGREINDLQILNIYSIRDKYEIRKADCDFFISTIPFEKVGEKDVVAVGNILLPYDLRKIREMMNKIRKKKIQEINKRAVTRFQRNLFAEQLVFINLELTDKAELLKALCSGLEETGFVTGDFETSVLERENITSTDVGNMIAIPHGSSKTVVRSIISIAILKKPIRWNEEAEVDFVFLLALDLDESPEMKQQIMRFYQAFSLLLENEDEIKRIKEWNSPKKITDYFNSITKGYSE